MIILTYADTNGLRKFYESLFMDEKLRDYYTKMSGVDVHRIKITKSNFVSGDLKTCYGLSMGDKLIPFINIKGTIHKVEKIDEDE